MQRHIRSWIVLLVVTGFACNTGRQDATTIQAPSKEAYGFVAVAMIDAPIMDGRVTAVIVCFDRIDLVFNEGQPPDTINVSRCIDLLLLQGGVATLLGIGQFPVGRIQQIRLILSSASAVIDGVEQPLKVPSGEQTGLKLTFPGGFEIRENVTTTIILDFDAEKSLHFTDGEGWMLTPVVQLVEAAIVLAVTSPAPNSFVPRTLVVTGTVASQEPLVELTINGVPAVVVGVDWQAQITLPPESPALITVEAIDVLGRSAVVSFEVNVDGTPPQLRVFNPFQGSGLFFSSPVAVTGNALDFETGVATVVVEVADLTLVATVAPTGDFSVDVDIAVDIDPDNALVVTDAVVAAIDQAGNETRLPLAFYFSTGELARTLFVTFDRRLSFGQIASIVASHGAEPGFIVPDLNQLELVFPSGTDLDSAAAVLRARPEAVQVDKVPLGAPDQALPVVAPNDVFSIAPGAPQVNPPLPSSQFGLILPIHVLANRPAPGVVTDNGAWDIETGNFRTLLADIDDGFDYTHPDLFLNVWLNNGEIPAPGVDTGTPASFTALIDADGDGVISFFDLNQAVNLAFLRGPAPEIPERCGAAGLPENPALPCNPAVDGGDLVDGNPNNNVGYEGDLNGDGCPGVQGADDDGDGRSDLLDLQVMTRDYDRDGVPLFGPDMILQSTCAAPCIILPCDDDLGDIAMAAADDDENGFADDIIGWDFGCDQLDSQADRNRCAGRDFRHAGWDNAPLSRGVDNSHGTATASIIAAISNNGIGIAGINWQARVVLVAIGLDDYGPMVYPIPAFHYLNQVARTRHPMIGGDPIRAINTSFGFKASRANAASPTWSSVSLLDEAGALLVGSAGNQRELPVDFDFVPEGDGFCPNQKVPQHRCLRIPGGLPYNNVIAVAAVDRFGRIATAPNNDFYSNTGSRDVDLAATGANIITGGGVRIFDVIALNARDQQGFNAMTTSISPFNTTFIPGITTFGGTSAATPMVTGTLGLMSARNPALSNATVRSLLFSGVTVPDPRLDVSTGGILNAFRALELARDAVPPTPAGIPDADLAPRVTEDGRVVAFLTTRVTANNPKGQLRIATVDADLGRGMSILQVPQVQAEDVVDADFDINSDGTRVVFTSNRDGDNFEVFVVAHDPASGIFQDPTQLTLTAPTFTHFRPVISPDGVFAAFVRRPPVGSEQVVLMRIADQREFSIQAVTDITGVGFVQIDELALSAGAQILVADVTLLTAGNFGRVVAWRNAAEGAVISQFDSTKIGVAVTRDGTRVAYGSGCDRDASFQFTTIGCDAYGIVLVDMAGFDPPAPFDVVANSTIIPPVGPKPSDVDGGAFRTQAPFAGAISDDGTILSWVEHQFTGAVLEPLGARTLVVGNDLAQVLVVTDAGTDDIFFIPSENKSFRSDLSGDGQRLVYVRAIDEVLGVSVSPQRVFRLEGFVPVPVRVTSR